MNGTLQNNKLGKYNLSYEKIAKQVSGISSKSTAYDLLHGTKQDKTALLEIQVLLEKAGMPDEEIWQFPAFQGGSKMLKELLTKEVFSKTITDSSEIYESSSFQDCFAAMFDAINRQKFIAIYAESGSGKTSLLRYLEGRCLHNTKIIISRLNNTDFEKVRARNIYEALVYDIQENESPKRSTEALIRQVRDILKSHMKEDKKVVLVVDEAHHINKNTLLALKGVWENTHGFQRLLGVILLGQEDLAGKLERNGVKEVKARTERIHLRSVNSVEEVKEYIEHQASMKDISVNGEIEDAVYEEIFKKRQSFLGINLLMNEAIARTLTAKLDTLTVDAVQKI